MKVLLAAINSKFIHSNLAVRYLKAYTKDLNYECKIREFTINDRKEKILEEIIMEKPDIVAFSCYIWNLDYVESLTRLIKLVNPEIKILIGGPEVSFDCESVMNKLPIDFIIEGEGEPAYRELIINLLNSNDVSNIKSLYYRKDGYIKYGGKRELMNMNQVVFPYQIDENLDNKIVYYEASRGCPFNCIYCLSSTIHGVRFLSVERVKAELNFFIEKGVKLVKFVDRTFNCNEKFAIDIWEYIINLDTDCTFHFEISADILTEKEVKLLEKAPVGRIQFEVGVQTTNNEILNNINRHVNFESIKEKVEEIKKTKNIKQHLDLIAGLPGEDLVSFRNSFNEVYKIDPEEIQLGFLKLLKGSPMREEASKWGMAYSPYPPYEILKTNTMSYENMITLKKIEEVLDKYFNSRKFTNILDYFTEKFETSYDFYYALGEYFYNKGYLNRNISSSEYYKVFLDFNEEFLENDNKLLEEIIKFDYLMYNRKKWLPPFLNRSNDKKIDKEISNTLIAQGKEISKEDFHIEKFDLDILTYIKSKKEIWQDTYVIFPIVDSSKKIYSIKYC